MKMAKTDFRVAEPVPLRQGGYHLSSLSNLGTALILIISYLYFITLVA